MHWPAFIFDLFGYMDEKLERHWDEADMRVVCDDDNVVEDEQELPFTYFAVCVYFDLHFATLLNFLWQKFSCSNLHLIVPAHCCWLYMLLTSQVIMFSITFANGCVMEIEWSSFIVIDVQRCRCCGWIETVNEKEKKNQRCEGGGW